MTMAKRVGGFHTNQPYIEFGRYLLDDGREVVVKFGGMRQTWDLQPYRAPTCIVDGPSSQEVIDELRESFPRNEYFAELLPSCEEI
jgi:hypothetical protein